MKDTPRGQFARPGITVIDDGITTLDDFRTSRSHLALLCRELDLVMVQQAFKKISPTMPIRIPMKNIEPAVVYP